jgi:hypothetical protein
METDGIFIDDEYPPDVGLGVPSLSSRRRSFLTCAPLRTGLASWPPIRLKRGSSPPFKEPAPRCRWRRIYPIARFTVSKIWVVDDALTAQLARWPFFRNAGGANSDEGYYANHFLHCGAGSGERGLQFWALTRKSSRQSHRRNRHSGLLAGPNGLRFEHCGMASATSPACFDDFFGSGHVYT